MSNPAIGALLGLVCAAGALILIGRIAATSRPRLDARVLPFVPGASRNAIDEPTPSRVIVDLLTPQLTRGRTLLATLSGAGRSGELDRFRLEQVVGGVLGVIAGGGLGLIAILRGTSPIALPVLAFFGAVIGLLVVDRQLAQRARKRSARMGRELPVVAELLAFAVAAGESPASALDRVSHMTEGELSAECRRAVGELRAGSSFDEALRALAARSGNADVERFVDGIIVAVERGTPLVDVLRAQAADARAADRRALLESAGRKDVLMLVPVVFFILPTVVAIALYPGMQSLKLVVP